MPLALTWLTRTQARLAATRTQVRIRVALTIGAAGCRGRSWLPRARRWLSQACPCLETTRRCRWHRWLPQAHLALRRPTVVTRRLTYDWRRWLPQACPCLAGDAQALPLAPLAACRWLGMRVWGCASGDARAPLAAAGTPARSWLAQACPCLGMPRRCRRRRWLPRARRWLPPKRRPSPM